MGGKNNIIALPNKTIRGALYGLRTNKTAKPKDASEYLATAIQTDPHATFREVIRKIDHRLGSSTTVAPKMMSGVNRYPQMLPIITANPTATATDQPVALNRLERALLRGVKKNCMNKVRESPLKSADGSVLERSLPFN